MKSSEELSAASIELLDTIYYNAGLAETAWKAAMARGMDIGEFARLVTEINAQYERDLINLGGETARRIRNRAILAIGSEEDPGYVKDPEEENGENQDF
jgi:hypothetical protein